MSRTSKLLWALSVVGIPCTIASLYWFFTVYKKKSIKDVPKVEKEKKDKITVLYGTCTGTARLMAQSLGTKLRDKAHYDVEIWDMKDFNEDKLEDGGILLVLCSTWIDGSAPETAKRFVESLRDLVHDFRVSKSLLSKLKFAVFGLGGAIYGGNFAKIVSGKRRFFFIANFYEFFSPSHSL